MSVAADPAATPGAHRRRGKGFRAPSRSQLHAVIEAQRILACAPPDPEVIFRLLAETAWSVLGCTGAIVSQPTADSIVVRGVAGETPNRPRLHDPARGHPDRRRGSDPHRPDLRRLGHTTHAPGQPPITARCPSSSSRSSTQGEVIALLGAHASHLGAFDEQDLELLAMLAEVGANRLAHALTLHSRDELQAQSSAVLAAMTAGLTVLDLNGAIQFANPAALEMFGLTPDEMTGLTNRDERWGCRARGRQPVDRRHAPQRGRGCAPALRSATRSWASTTPHGGDCTGSSSTRFRSTTRRGP